MPFSTLGICPVLTIVLHLWMVDLLLGRLARRRVDPWFAWVESAILIFSAGLLLTFAKPALDSWQGRPVILISPSKIAALFAAKLLIATGSHACRLALDRQAILPAIRRLGPSIILRSLGSALMIVFAAWAIWAYILFGAAYATFLVVDLAIWLLSRRWQTGSLLAVPLDVTAFFVLGFLWMLVTAGSDAGFFAGIIIIKVATISLSVLAQKGMSGASYYLQDIRHLLAMILRAAGVGAVACWFIFRAPF